MANQTQTAVPESIGAPPAKPPIWNDPRYRALFFQILVLGGVIAAGIFLQDAQHLRSGFIGDELVDPGGLTLVAGRGCKPPCQSE